ncbi:MAG: hypothetical protein A2Z18_05385 [Armatimonadetes bacterium RBG_16_58_9]|nr:MAG: hypothetical protein A2Z18_05385 [Armatimonadetes bacterium RBG_16_58_9]
MNRIPYIVLGLLVLVAIIYRILNPPQPDPPGPKGAFPGWTSVGSVGKMSSQAVNPTGAAWAGAWNQQDSPEGLKSAVWILDFTPADARMCKMKDNTFTSFVGWADDKTVRALAVDDANPNVVTESDIVYIDARTGKANRTERLKNPVKRIIVWPAGSDKFVAELAHEEPGVKIAVLSESGEIVGQAVKPDLPKGAKVESGGAMSSDGAVFIFPVSDKSARGGRAYCIADSRDGSCKNAFDLKGIPGRLEGMWIAFGHPHIFDILRGPEDVVATALIVCSAREKFLVAQYWSMADDIEVLKNGVPPADLKHFWTDAPKEMLFVTYNGGYRFDLANGKTKKLFDYSKLGPNDETWRQNVRNGRLYPAKNGYISVSVNVDMVDIRQTDKKGIVKQNLLPR